MPATNKNLTAYFETLSSEEYAFRMGMTRGLSVVQVIGNSHAEFMDSTSWLTEICLAIYFRILMLSFLILTIPLPWKYKFAVVMGLQFQNCKATSTT